MIIGDPKIFAIESGISIAYEELGARALGFFVIHLGGHCYGVREPDATWMASSFDEVERRLVQRGMHTAPFASEPEAGKIADAFGDAIYAPDKESDLLLNIPQPEFSNFIYANKLQWAPDGDEAFDDGSCVLHFDVEARVRLIGFKCAKDEYHHAPDTLNDVWLDADKFYEILKAWLGAFEAERLAAPKPFKAHSQDGASEEHLAEIIRLQKLSESIRQS